MKQIAYLANQVFTGTEWLPQQAVVTKENKIVALLPAEQLPDDMEVKKYAGSFLAPAFIDIQLYGAYGKLLAVMPEPSSVQAIADYCRKGGATLGLPTVATNAIEVFQKSIDAVRLYWQQGGQGIFGLHLEGPWINKEKRGAHSETYIHAPTLAEVKDLLAYGKDVIKMITLAPEVCSKEVIDYLLQNDIIISAGHSNATYAEATQAFEQGITIATHLYNAMSPLGHRQPGMVGALFNHAKAMCSIIPDGHHVDYAAIKIAKKQMGERLFVITDAVTETSSGFYQHQLEGDKYVCNGILSGSALTMHKAMVNLVQQAGIEVAEALRMCSLYPARVLKQEHQYGKIAPGYAAQFVIINNSLELVDTVIG